MPSSDTALSLALDLMGRESITPQDAGCQELLGQRLAALGFEVQAMPVNGVTNLWATLGTGQPTLCFAGHTDVVPPGKASAWDTPPFEPRVTEDGWLKGRGAADMKSSLAAMLVATERYLAKHQPTGRLAFLITSDEEGPAVDGTQAVLAKLKAAGESIEYCVIGEPTADTHAGDHIRIGRRGSLHADITVTGIQGHVAYPSRVNNPAHTLTEGLQTLLNHSWPEPPADFPALSTQVTDMYVDAIAENVVPAQAHCHVNWRYPPTVSVEAIQTLANSAFGENVVITWRESARPFQTPTDSPLRQALIAAVQSVCGKAPRVSAGGGTSDGRFFAPMGTHVVECGPCNATIHQVNEAIRVEELDVLTRIYEAVLGDLLGSATR